PYEDIPLSNIRKVIATRLSESKISIPHYYITVELNADDLLKLREKLNAAGKGSYKLSVNDFVIKAAKTGLITPIIPQAEGKGLSAISNQLKELAVKARDGKLAPHEYQGGSFSISNLGMYGVQSFTAIVNPPHAAILAVGGVEDKLALDASSERGFVSRKVFKVTLSCDHRVVDGAVGAQWLQKFKGYIEDPISMILGSHAATRTLSIVLAAAAAILLVGVLLPPSAAATNNNYPNTAGDASDSAVALHEPASAASESLSEHLRLEQFDDGRVLSLFNFSRSFRPAAVDAVSRRYFSLFPKTVGDIVQAFGVAELHLTFSHGRWQYENWGYSPAAAAPGVQLWAWFNATDVDRRWKGLTNALAGTFCASLNFIDQPLTAEPTITFAPEGRHAPPRTFSSETASSSTLGRDGFQLRYGALPREITCTENLTPWTKLLPCRTKAGLATLFNPYRLYDTDFHSMAVHIRTDCGGDDACADPVVTLTQTLAAVFDPIRMSASRTD
ncbi:hypothetical protein HK405_009774, partial [Cladochytrium tenue]